MSAQDERFVHRLEAFSDVVIGFSLAQLGATLIVPLHAVSLVQHPGWIFAFLWTFALVCLMWSTHNRIFRLGFSATPLAVTLNFVVLATIVLLVYFAQVFARSQNMHDTVVAARLYFGMLATNYLITAWLYRACSGPRKGIAINAVSGAFQALVLLATLPLGDNQIIFPVLGISVPAGFVVGGYAGRPLQRSSASA